MNYGVTVISITMYSLFSQGTLEYWSLFWNIWPDWLYGFSYLVSCTLQENKLKQISIQSDIIVCVIEKFLFFVSKIRIDWKAKSIISKFQKHYFIKSWENWVLVSSRYQKVSKFQWLS